MPKPQEILEELKRIKYPGLSRDIVSFGMVRDIEIGSQGVTVLLAPTTAREDVVSQIRAQVVAVVGSLEGVGNVEVVVTEAEAQRRAQSGGPVAIPGVRDIIAVASGKGGVGKSTVAANLALALRADGARVGLLDCDIYGPSIPVMLGLSGHPEGTADKRILPHEKHGLRVLSFGSFVEPGTPVIWRGPMLNKALTQFFRDTEWGELDYLVLDLPPGTGDVQLTITQQVPLAGGVIVTTPSDVALLDVRRGVKMFQQVKAPVLGVIENMSFHECRHCGHRTELFGHGAGEKFAAELGIPFLGGLPLVRAIREAGDAGTPIVVAQPEHPQSRAIRQIAQRVIETIRAQPSVGVPRAAAVPSTGSSRVHAIGISSSRIA